MGFFEVNKIPLKVLMNDGFDVEGSNHIKETDLLYDTASLNAPTFYFNTGYRGTEFEISVLIREEYYYKNRHYTEYLTEWDKNNTVVSVVTDAMDIPNSKYVMQIKGKKQTMEHYSIWKLRFKQYYEDSSTFNNTSVKTSSLSSIDQTLIKYNTINSNSPKNVIYALQRKLMDKGCFDAIKKEYVNGVLEYVLENDVFLVDRTITGVWDSQMKTDIFLFQAVYMNDQSKQGECDAETIKALLGDYFELNGLTLSKENLKQQNVGW